MTTIMNKIKNMFGFGRSEHASAPSSEGAHAGDAAAANFLANQAKDRAAKLQEVQDKAAHGVG